MVSPHLALHSPWHQQVIARIGPADAALDVDAPHGYPFNNGRYDVDTAEILELALGARGRSLQQSLKESLSTGEVRSLQQYETLRASAISCSDYTIIPKLNAPSEIVRLVFGSGGFKLAVFAVTPFPDAVRDAFRGADLLSNRMVRLDPCLPLRTPRLADCMQLYWQGTRAESVFDSLRPPLRIP